jgi:hypothetical protein
MWVWLDKVHPKRYDTFFEFAPYERKEYSEFEAIRWTSIDGIHLKTDESGKLIETVVKFKRGSGTKAEKFVEEGTDLPFQLNGGTKTGEAFMTGAILVKPDRDSEPIRMNAQLEEDKQTQAKSYPQGEKRFMEENGSRYVVADQLGVLYVPSTGTVMLALFINFMLFAVWFIAFWPILQFSPAHAFGFTTLFGLITMLLVMPLLFKQNRAKPAIPEPPRVAWASRDETSSHSGLG